MILPADFYHRPTLDVARDLIGKVLVRDARSTRTAGVIVEVEAYIGEDDPACHAAPGPTARNAPLYGPPGVAYVYLNYGLHALFNAVTEPEGAPAAVLIRALEPVEGLSLMRRRRSRAPWRRGKPLVPDHELCRGPGNLTCALGITLADNRRRLTAPPLSIEDRGLTAGEIEWSSRIGISVGTEHAWRCSARGHASLSGPRTRRGPSPA
ncbi:MAG: DNA-3-methyladenine glycosylase [Acidobacteria bacterium]|nr:DNA-3-methyladenine glycosylase [Acidobacteriota bacterium]